jgi:hypothetical protein
MPQFNEQATFISGALVTTQGATVSGGVTPYSLISAATTNATSVKGAAGQVYTYHLYNTTSAAKFVRFFDKATAPTVGTDVPIIRFMVPALGGVVVHTNGQQFSTGIAFDITGALGDADATAVAVGDVFVNLGYK